MKKLSRFLILAAIFVATSAVFYSVIPAIVWIFGGEFRAVAQNPGYAIFFLFIGLPCQSFLFSECIITGIDGENNELISVNEYGDKRYVYYSDLKLEDLAMVHGSVMTKNYIIKQVEVC